MGARKSKHVKLINKRKRGENMLISIFVNEKWSKPNKKYFEDKGYIFTEYGDTFTVNTKDLKEGSHTHVDVSCDYCGCIYSMAYKNYIKSIKKYGNISCKKCVGTRCAEITLNKRIDVHYNKILDICERNNYELLSLKEDIINNKTRIKYLCAKHGIQESRIGNFLNGKLCKHCAKESMSDLFRMSIDDVEKRFSEFGSILLNKEDYIKNDEKNLKVICSECGDIFITSLKCFSQHGGQVCEKCSGKESAGERAIRYYLENRGINFVQEKWFKECRDINPLPFDFYLNDYDVIIEYNGRQHYEETDYFSYSLEKTKKHDNIKSNYCKLNGIKLIVIPYTQYNKIEEILDKELILHEDIV